MVDKKRNIQGMFNQNEQITEDHPFYLPFYIGLHCGVRVGEVCGLEWKHKNFDEMTIEIERQLTK